MVGSRESVFPAGIALPRRREVVGCARRAFPIGPIDRRRPPRHTTKVLDSILTYSVVAPKRQASPRFGLSYHIDAPVVLEDVNVLRAELQRG